MSEWAKIAYQIVLFSSFEVLVWSIVWKILQAPQQNICGYISDFVTLSDVYNLLLP